MKKIIPLLFLILFFLIIKAVNNEVRLSDTNTYFNIAYQMSQGKLIYRDFFFSNFPFFSYVSFLYYFLIGRNVELFYFTSAVEASAIAILIYFSAYRKTKDDLVSALSTALYIFSFIVLSTSDHQTGVFTASLFAVLSYFFLQKKKILLSGAFIAFAVFTKAYFIPILLSFLAFLVIKKGWKNLLKFGISFTLTGLLILLPFLILSPHQLISDIFFSLVRPIGLSKINILWFFITKDFLLFLLLIFNLINYKKNILFSLISIFSIIFLSAYQDIYYLYLNFLTPFLCISFYEMYYFLKNTFNLQKAAIPTFVAVFILLNLLAYTSSYRNIGKFEDFNKVKAVIISENPKYLYGVNDITPLLIALTHIPALENVNEAHEYFFARKIYDKKLLTDKAVENKTLVVTHGADYPQYGIRQDILDNIFIKETIYENCQNILSAPVISEGDANRITLFRCY